MPDRSGRMGLAQQHNSGCFSQGETPASPEYWDPGGDGSPSPSPGIFPTRGSNSGLLHCRQSLSDREAPNSKGYQADTGCESRGLRVSREERRGPDFQSSGSTC